MIGKTDRQMKEKHGMVGISWVVVWALEKSHNGTTEWGPDGSSFAPTRQEAIDKWDGFKGQNYARDRPKGKVKTVRVYIREIDKRDEAK